MKTIKIVAAVLFMMCFTNQLMAQNSPITEPNKKESKKKLKTQNNNLLDMQANVYTGILGENLDGKPTGKSIGFLELLEKLDLPEKQKLEYKNQYYLQSKELTQKDKDSLGNALKQKIIEAQNNPKK